MTTRAVNFVPVNRLPQTDRKLALKAHEGYSFMLRSPNQRANQIRRSYKNEEFHWLFDFVTVT